MEITVRCSFGGHLKFQNGRHLNFKMAAILNGGCLPEYVS